MSTAPALAEVATSRAGAARMMGLSASTVAGWARKGWLPAGPPWTRTELESAHARADKRLANPGLRSEHGEQRWRAGCRCDLCRTAHNADSKRRRRAEADARWRVVTAPLLEDLATGTGYSNALARVGMTPQGATKRRILDPQFSDALDAALMAGRNPALAHGTSTAWRAGCRCPECRDKHERHRR